MFRLFRPATPARLIRCRNLTTGTVLPTWIPAGCPIPEGWEEVTG